MIKLYNSLSRELEVFTPQDPERVTMYACGPTVYGAAHIGNARPAVVFDTLARVLAYDFGFHRLHYVSNFTDVDDKIIQAAAEAGTNMERMTEYFSTKYLNDMRSLGNNASVERPRATDYIPNMVNMIERLITKGHAYVVEGEVFFSVPSNPYPGIANHAEGGLQSGEHRIAADTKKRDPRDFVLWKPAKEGEPYWPSPWSKGRPGWHIECSSMIEETLGTTIDIHAGGQDLRFPHHEAEMAQSACAHDGAPLARYWIHNGMLTVDGEKMSKSLNNVVLVDDLLLRYPGESIRYLMLLTHYRSPLDYTKSGLARAHRSLTSLYSTLWEYKDVEALAGVHPNERLMDKLRSDLNTPGAIGDLHALAGFLRNRDDKPFYKAQLIKSGQALGLFKTDVEAWMTTGVDKLAIDALIEERNAARAARDFAEADRIRDQLAHMGITVADGAHGTSWRKT